jgi:signal transduction histidine kinase
MFVVAAALLVLIAVLATLQYRWLGRISDAERERMTATLGAHAVAFAHEFDRELTRAYLTFQLEPAHEAENGAARMALRHERWVATSRYPRLIKEIYIASRDDDGDADSLQRFDPATRFVEPAEWPDSLRRIKEALTKQHSVPSGETLVIRTIPSAVWDDIPALVIPAPVMLLNERVTIQGAQPQNFRMLHSIAFTILVLDRDYISGELLPSLAQQQFRATSSAPQYQVAVVSKTSQDVVYKSNAAFVPDANAPADASADFFQVRLQEFSSLATEVRKFTATVAPRPGAVAGQRRSESVTQFVPRDGAPVSIMVQQGLNAEGKAATIPAGGATTWSRTATTSGGGPRWRLVLKHPSGSLEVAVNSARRRNLIVSSSVLALLGISVGFLVVTTRRAQELARQQMEFVAAVSHELRTPLAVIRSAADNLAEGVVHDEAQVRRYGELVRGEGRRLTEMVEQILELAGIHSGQRSFALRPVALDPLLQEIMRAASTLLDQAHIDVEYDVPEGLPPALGDERALRRVFQNLVSNAIKYGAQGRWIGLSARTSGRQIVVSVADRGVGIPAAEQVRIFEPFYRAPAAISAQIQGAGLGLSLVQRIVEAHGGRITVRSTEGSGSEFTVHLPAATEEPVTRNASAPDVTAGVPTQP